MGEKRVDILVPCECKWSTRGGLIRGRNFTSQRDRMVLFLDISQLPFQSLLSLPDGIMTNVVQGCKEEGYAWLR